MDSMMNEDQKKRAIQIWNKYTFEGERFINASQEFGHDELDCLRNEVIPEINAVLHKFLSGEFSLDEFKTRIDSINKRNRLWGFKGINGQMFFNLLVKTSFTGGKTEEFIALLKRCLILPASLDIAVKLLDEFALFTKSLSKFVQDLRGAPKLGSVNFFLSYFWQVQSPSEYPVYYSSMISVLQEYNLWSPSQRNGESYASFFQLNHRLRELFSKVAGRKLSLWDVEHAFWFMTLHVTNPKPDPKELGVPQINNSINQTELPDSFVPPIVSILPRLAANDSELAKRCVKMGSSIEVVFEKRIDVLFKMLGFETEALGQGHGRVPDGVAICREFHYCIGYDAKVRQQSYTMGTDERAIKEYIIRLSDRLKKQGIKQVYFMVISSSFSGDHDDIIRSLKMDTDVREVLLVEVGALVAMLEAKLRDPLLTLGPEGLQRLFADSGILREVDVREFSGM